MSEPFVFDSRCDACKYPFGAVHCGTEVTFHCRPLLTEGFTHCALVLSGEFSGNNWEIELERKGQEGDRFCFEAVINAPDSADLVWYHFRFWRDDGTGCILDRTGYRSDGGLEPWQLTVYEPSHTPDWYGAGLTYQIFPDRYCRLEKPDPTGMVGDRIVHNNWDEVPLWRPDEKGEVRNRDFFGGSLAGIIAHLDDLAGLGVTTLYLCPIFESASNHRYNTADYETIDPMLGTEEDFRELCRQARQFGIRVILDGVFNHTGSQSRYFNADGFYPTLGAGQSMGSPYYPWFSFHPWPVDYESWWGIKTLPAVNEDCPSYIDYIIENQNSIIRRWLRAGASGWRLDVADELPDWFIEKLRTVVEETDPNAILIGEVWEDGTTKIAYNQRRRYLLGHELHGLMNYPFRTALLDYLRGGDADAFRETMETQRENYPREAFYSAMNFLGTHDTARILTLLGTDFVPDSKETRASYRLSPAQRMLGLERVRLAALMLFTFPGSPTIYYGDEVGLEGFEDPFNRGTYPWGNEDHLTRAYFARLGQLRQKRQELQTGELRWDYTSGPLLVYSRELPGRRCTTAINADPLPQMLRLPWNTQAAVDLLTGRQVVAEQGCIHVQLEPCSGLLLTEL